MTNFKWNLLFNRNQPFQLVVSVSIREILNKVEWDMLLIKERDVDLIDADNYHLELC